MSETLEKLSTTAVENLEQAAALIEKLFTVARPDAVFGEPVEVEGRTIITASEVNVGMGFGFGLGGATPPGRAGRPAHHEEGSEEQAESEGEEAGMGGGGGGGGGASGRPVAVISVSEDGVRVEPVVDATKLGLAFFTALGSMFFMLSKMRKAASR